MNIIMGQMSMMGFTADAQTAGQNNGVTGVPGDFMQQILMDESAEQVLVNIAPTKTYAVVTASEVLTKFKVPEVVHAQDPALQPKDVRQAREPISEPTVVYLLHWLASGHLSHIATDLTASMPVQINPAAMLAVANNGNSSNDLPHAKSPGEIAFEGNKIGFKHFDNNALDIDTSENERQRKAADAAIFIEQISPYLKRKLIVSTQEDHTHIILRDYFLDDQDNFSELKDLLTNIKQNIPGNIQLTINGHHYGDINNYR